MHLAGRQDKRCLGDYTFIGALSVGTIGMWGIDGRRRVRAAETAD